MGSLTQAWKRVYRDLTAARLHNASLTAQCRRAFTGGDGCRRASDGRGPFVAATFAVFVLLCVIVAIVAS